MDMHASYFSGPSRENVSRLFGFVFVFCALMLLEIAISVVTIAAQGGPPMITDDTETVAPHHWEINTAFTMEVGADGRVFGVPLLDINYGLTKNTQVKVEVPWLVLHQNGRPGINALGNTNVGVRWRFRDEDEKHRVAMSIYPQLEFNNLDSAVRRGIVDKGPEFLMPLQWQTELGKFGLGGDIGYRFKRGPDEVIYGIILGREFGDAFELMGEIHGSGQRLHLAESEVVFNLGSRVKVTKHSVLLLSAGRSIRSEHDPKFIGYAGLQVNF